MNVIIVIIIIWWTLEAEVLFKQLFSLFFTEQLYKEPAVCVPSLQRLSKIARDLGLDMEEGELKEYRGRFFKNREILSSRFVKILMVYKESAVFNRGCLKNLGVVYYCYRGYFQDSR